ncbi:MAG: hypothetical protein ACI4MC_00730 [Candidatus Coproplasma sp.]
MFKILRIISCIIAALCVAACVFVFIYAGVIWGICTLLGALVFFALTVLFKRYQEDGEEKLKGEGVQHSDDEKTE